MTRRGLRRGAWPGLVLVLTAAAVTPAAARVLLTQEDALAEAFPGAEVQRFRRALSPEQAEQVRELAGTAPDSRLVIAYRAERDGHLVGTAYFDAHVVRTLPEVLLVVVSPEGTVDRVDVLSFREPVDYLPPRRWLAQFPGRPLDGDLALKRGIQGITGATLTSRAITAAVRRVLATHAVLAASASEVPGSGGRGEEADGAAAASP